VPTLLPPLHSECNSGKGRAVIRGWGLAEGHDLVAFADADGAVSAREILRAEEHMRSPGCMVDALFAGRFKMLGRRVDRSLRRHLAGRVFATLVSELSRVPVYDSQCGLKIIRNAPLRMVYPHLAERGFAFDVELLLLLLKAGFAVEEFPVDWSDVPGSKVSLLRDSWRMACQVVRINRRLRRMGPMVPLASAV
jgi:glycosyltransferase involved in cell wall biosynthesis